jgi:hypothetical protein
MVENVPSRLFDADGRQSSIDNVARQAFVDNSIRCRPLFSPSESEPAVGNQLFGYPNGADLSRWFERKQTATLSYWTIGLRPELVV